MRWRMGREKSRKRLRGALYLKAHLATLNSKQFRLKSFLRKCNSGDTALFASHKMRRKYLVKNSFSNLLISFPTFYMLTNITRACGGFINLQLISLWPSIDIALQWNVMFSAVPFPICIVHRPPEGHVISQYVYVIVSHTHSTYKHELQNTLVQPQQSQRSSKIVPVGRSNVAPDSSQRSLSP